MHPWFPQVVLGRLSIEPSARVQNGADRPRTGGARWYPIGYHEGMEASSLVHRARTRAGLSLRELARRAGTSHSTLSAYETGRKVPTVETLDRIVRAAGFVAGVDLEPDVGGPDRAARGRELVEVLELAAMFPARHAPTLEFPASARREAPTGARRWVGR